MALSFPSRRSSDRMGAHLRQGGHEVCVYNRTSGRADEWVTRHGGRRADTPAEAAHGADAVFTCVGADADLQQVVLGKDGALAAMRPGAVLVDHTTVSAKIARRLAEEAASKGLLAVAAPVSGGQAGAESGKLAVLGGGRDGKADVAGKRR